MRLQPKLFLCLLTVLVLGSPLVAAEDDSKFNSPQNTLIADQFNNRVVEVDPAGNVVWQFGLGPDKVDASFADHTIIGTNDAQRVGTFTLIAGTGTPQGQPESPACAANGCADNRVILVNRKGKIVWQYGQFGVTGAGFDQLNVPVQNTWLPNAHVLITDQSNERIIEVDAASKNIVWQYGTTGVMGSDVNQLNNPNCAELLRNGHILICDENNNRAIEVTHTTPSSIVATFSAGGTASGVAFASRLSNGNTLLTDSNNSRIVEVDAKDHPVWEYFTNTDPNSNPRCLPGPPVTCTGPLPTRALRLKNGNTLISDQYNHRVIEVNHAKQLVRTWGTENVLGYDTHNVDVSTGGLNSPYDAKRNGDYTGITPPFGFEE